MFSAVASGIFAVRNADKAKNGDIGRGAVTVGQTAGLVQEAAKCESVFSGTVRGTLSGLSNLAKEYKAVDYAGKAIKFAADNVNPLICASGVLKTAMSDDKVGTGITETAALATMFAGEGLVKLNYDKLIESKQFKDLLEKASKTKNLEPVFKYLEKHNLKGKLGTIIKGLVFVGGSMGSYAIGQALGDDIADRVKANLNFKEHEKINHMA